MKDVKKEARRSFNFVTYVLCRSIKLHCTGENYFIPLNKTANVYLGNCAVYVYNCAIEK